MKNTAPVPSPASSLRGIPAGVLAGCRGGFTLIELLVVAAAIAIPAAPGSFVGCYPLEAFVSHLHR